jgi:hypothetical protein
MPFPYDNHPPRVVGTERGTVRLLSDQGVDRPLGEEFLDLGDPGEARKVAALILAEADQVDADNGVRDLLAGCAGALALAAEGVGAGALAWAILRVVADELVVGDDVELAGRLLDAFGHPLGGTDDPDEVAVDRLAAHLGFDRRDTERLLAAVLAASDPVPPHHTARAPEPRG